MASIVSTIENTTMTTIVVDREMGYMAADRMASSNDCEVAIECPKIRKIELSDGIHLMACAGMESSAQLFENWYTHGAWDEPLETMESTEDVDNFTAVILTPSYEIWLADKFMCPYQIYLGIPHNSNNKRSRWYGAGTGGSFAWAALWSGVSIDVAMVTATEMDPSSGFGFDIEYLEDSSYG